MNNRLALPTTGIVLVLCVGILMPGANRGLAWAVADDAINQNVLKLAAAIKDGKNADVKKLTAELAKNDFRDVMGVYSPTSKGGLAVQLQLQKIARAAPAPNAVAQAVEMTYILDAVAEVGALKGPPAGLKNVKKDWDDFTKQSKDLSASLRQALKKGQPVKDIAQKIDNNCSACHAQFKSN